MKKKNDACKKEGNEILSTVLAAPQSFSGQILLPSNMTCKKDSGYGSQGQIRLEQLRLPDAGILKNLNTSQLLRQ